MTTMSSAEYVAAEGTMCPVCKSHELEGEESEFGGQAVDEATMKVQCVRCNAEWVDVYKLIGYREL